MIESSETTSQTVEPTVTTETQTEIVKDPSAVLAKNKELLGKYSKAKSELEELREFKKSQLIQEEEKKGNYEGVIKSLREELGEIKSQRKKDYEDRAYQTLESKIETAAQNEGCVNTKKLMRLMTKEQMASVELLQDNGQFNVHGDDIKRLMDTLKEEHKDIGLFRNNQPNIATVGGGFKAAAPKAAAQLSSDELKDRLRNL